MTICYNWKVRTRDGHGCNVEFKCRILDYYQLIKWFRLGFLEIQNLHKIIREEWDCYNSFIWKDILDSSESE